MTLKEKMFEYLRENPKAPHKEIVENTGIHYDVVKTYMCRAKQKGEIKELEDGGYEVIKEPPVEKSSYKKEIVMETIEIYREDFKNAIPGERVGIGKEITKLLEKL